MYGPEVVHTDNKHLSPNNLLLLLLLLLPGPSVPTLAKGYGCSER